METVFIGYRGRTVKNKRVGVYITTQEPVATPVDTGITVEELLHSGFAVVSMSFISIVNGTPYILYNNVYTSALEETGFYDVRVSQNTEFETGSGDVSFSFWIDSTTLTIWFDYDFDGGTPIFGSVAMSGIRLFV